MYIEYYPLEKLKREIASIIFKQLDAVAHRLFFFGSRVNGTNNERSDIDVDIEGHRRITSEKFLAIQEEIENIPTLYKIDVIDFQRITSEFREIASKHIEIIEA